MGLIICPIHGESGFSLRFSKKVVDSIESDVVLDESILRIFQINLIDDEDGELLFTRQYLLLEEEFQKMKLNEIVNASTEEMYDRYSAALPELSGICFGCLADYKSRHNLDLLGFN